MGNSFTAYAIKKILNAFFSIFLISVAIFFAGTYHSRRPGSRYARL